MVLKGYEIRDIMCTIKFGTNTWDSEFELGQWSSYSEEIEYKYPDFHKWLNDLELICQDEKYLHYELFARRPYYQMRGKPVTEEQAFEIIRRCDNSFEFAKDLIQYTPKEGELPTKLQHIASWLFDEHHYPNGYGWCYPDGLIGTNGICARFPNTLELTCDFIKLMYHFPYLDAVWAFTWCDEQLYDYTFDGAVTLGFRTHDNKIEILDEDDTLKKYKEYAQKYEKEAWMYDSKERDKRKNREELMRYAQKCSEANKRDSESNEYYKIDL